MSFSLAPIVTRTLISSPLLINEYSLPIKFSNRAFSRRSERRDDFRDEGVFWLDREETRAPLSRVCGCCGFAVARLDEEAEEEVEVRGWDSTFSLWLGSLVLSSLDQGRGFSSFHSAALCMFVGGGGSCGCEFCGGRRCRVFGGCWSVEVGMACVAEGVYRVNTRVPPSCLTLVGCLWVWTATGQHRRFPESPQQLDQKQTIKHCTQLCSQGYIY